MKQISSEVIALSKKCQKIANSIEQLEEYSYHFNVKIIGAPQKQQTETAEHTSKLCIDLFHSIGAEVTIQDIAHRVPSRKPGNHSNAIICKFVRRLAREKVMAARKKLTDLQPTTRIYDHLTHGCKSFYMKPRNISGRKISNFVGLRIGWFIYANLKTRK